MSPHQNALPINTIAIHSSYSSRCSLQGGKRMLTSGIEPLIFPLRKKYEWDALPLGHASIYCTLVLKTI
jgi:hypothetical protein